MVLESAVVMQRVNRETHYNLRAMGTALLVLVGCMQASLLIT